MYISMTEKKMGQAHHKSSEDQNKENPKNFQRNQDQFQTL